MLRWVYRGGVKHIIGCQELKTRVSSLQQKATPDTDRPIVQAKTVDLTWLHIVHEKKSSECSYIVIFIINFTKKLFKKIFLHSLKNIYLLFHTNEKYV